METEVVKMTASLLHGIPGETCGTMTTGGSESIIMSILAHKKWAAAERGIVAPEAIIPRSAHAAFAKGCTYFDVKMVLAPLDDNYRVDVNAVRKLITRNTVLIVGSAPTFPQVIFLIFTFPFCASILLIFNRQGVIDPIEDLAAIAKEHNCGLHVDSCLGGYILPWLVELGHINKRFDFAVDGVTAMSAGV